MRKTKRFYKAFHRLVRYKQNSATFQELEQEASDKRKGEWEDENF